MRFKSTKQDGFQVFAIAGVNTVSFGITATDSARQNLLGFAVERGKDGRGFKYRRGFKVFASVLPKPGRQDRISTEDHPVQSLVWDDFTAEPDAVYVYRFHPLRGTPNDLDRSAKPVEIRVRTEPLYSDKEHDIFFNRGVASSQAYAREFGNKSPTDPRLSEADRTKMQKWLSRDLDDAILMFIRNAKKGDTLLCCFYEFRYEPVANELKAAIDRGVDVQIIVDAKENEAFNKKTGKMDPAYPREDNLKMIASVALPAGRIKQRVARKNAIQHNKFMVLLKGKQKKPSQVWTGSTNISFSGIHGQTNVGHWVRNAGVAEQFRDYWNLLSGDPGAPDSGNTSAGRAANKQFRDSVETLGAVPPNPAGIRRGVSTVFSPRTNLDVLNMYFDMVDSAKSLACITLAFGVSSELKKRLLDNTSHNHTVFMLLEKEDRPSKKKGQDAAEPAEPFVRLTATQNVYQAFGAYLSGDPVYGIVRKESDARQLRIGKHVAYIHSKFLLVDPLGRDPIVLTGSANFSKDSTKENDENMLIIRGDTRVADIYFTEFNRLFNHYYFRSVAHQTERRKAPDSCTNASLFLCEDDQWLKKYKPGSLRDKRVQMFANMSRFER